MFLSPASTTAGAACFPVGPVDGEGHVHHHHSHDQIGVLCPAARPGLHRAVPELGVTFGLLDRDVHAVNDLAALREAYRACSGFSRTIGLAPNMEAAYRPGPTPVASGAGWTPTA